MYYFFIIIIIYSFVFTKSLLLSIVCKTAFQNSVILELNRLFVFARRDIDKVDDLIQDITEQQEVAQEISDAISKPVGFGEEYDEVS